VFLGFGNCLGQRKNADLVAFGADDPYLGRRDVVIAPRPFVSCDV